MQRLQDWLRPAVDRVVLWTPDQVRSTYTFGFIIRPAVKSELEHVKVSATGREMVKEMMKKMQQNQQTSNLQIAFASSQEPDEGDAAYLVDGDPSTFWHTMYSITLAKYPHWVDFDAGKQKVIKGLDDGTPGYSRMAASRL